MSTFSNPWLFTLVVLAAVVIGRISGRATEVRTQDAVHTALREDYEQYLDKVEKDLTEEHSRYFKWRKLAENLTRECDRYASDFEDLLARYRRVPVAFRADTEQLALVTALAEPTTLLQTVAVVPQPEVWNTGQWPLFKPSNPFAPDAAPAVPPSLDEALGRYRASRTPRVHELVKTYPAQRSRKRRRK